MGGGGWGWGGGGNPSQALMLADQHFTTEPHASSKIFLKHFVGPHSCPFALRGKLALHLVPVPVPVGVAASLIGADTKDGSCC